MTDSSTPPALVAKRADSAPVETDEITALVSAAGYEVVGEVTQTRAEDPGTYLGAGKVEELTDDAADTGARLVVVDDELTPGQTKQLRDALPDEPRLYDRYRLILEIFGEQASTKPAQLQVELARLKYELPRIKAESDPQRMNVMLETGTRVHDAEKRIRELERKLDELPSPAERFRERRREQGFDLVTIAGYTNAGKSTLLHRLADELNLSSAEPDHSDKNATAAIEDRLFKTLETTTRRTTIDGRPVLVTDTVGFVQELPHWLVKSFSDTLSEAAAADVVVLVADGSDPLSDLRSKLRVSLDVLSSQGVEPESVIVALNKIDLLDEDEREGRLEAVSELAPMPIPISVTNDTNVDQLTDVVYERLPTATADLTMPNCSDAMSVVSWLHDRVTVERVDYADGTVSATIRGRPSVVERAKAKANEVSATDT
ncbi:GTP-binding proten HflX [Haladaptatus paucihalophilus DX253]|uniref:GTPase HflX n=1 Tax=Haladaptatus paucihalophilus DX253 TaxID=797209 RepID=E7QV01_HALPU|nr:GTPase HflX [Haladaptatus paucihalophilus]EFW91519.1 GTP-binding proten HflX [Haladaptatus paucihalophilus DX253]SHL25879.1 GTP-binding protein HflX [Haladaptatus paucihalophilus DX253]